MELIRLINRWFYFTSFMLLVSMILVLSKETVSVVGILYNWLSLFTFYFIVKKSIKKKYHSNNRLIGIILSVSILFLILYNILYFMKTGYFYEFSAKDTYEYEYFAIEMNKYSIYEGIVNYIKRGRPIDDLGAIFINSFAYRIYESPLILNILNVFAGLVTVLSIFRISLSFMSRKYAYGAALTYGLSSFVIYLYSTGMKETFFVMWIVLFFVQYLNYIKTKSLKSILIASILVSIVLFYRPAVAAMMGFSVLFSLIYGKKKGILNYLILLILFILGLYFYASIESINERFYGDANQVAYRAQHFSGIVANRFNYIVSFISGLIGPLPTYQAEYGRLQQSFYSVGLGFRVFISILFWLGVIKVMKLRNPVLISLSVFAIFEIISLSIILESFELRLNSPHFPAVYIVGFFFLDRIDRNQIENRALHIRIISVSYFIFYGLLFYWNLRL